MQFKKINIKKKKIKKERKGFQNLAAGAQFLSKILSGKSSSKPPSFQQKLLLQRTPNETTESSEIPAENYSTATTKFYPSQPTN